MAALTEEQKQTFLDLTRRGWNRGAAAKEIGSTGTQLRRMVDETCATYDHEFSLAYADACANQQPDGTAPEPRNTEWAEKRSTTARGYIRYDHLTDEQKDEFLERVTEGEHRYEAALAVGTSLGQINKLTARDPEFAKRHEEALLVGYPTFKDRLRAKATELAFQGDYRALRDLLVVHAEEYQVLRTTRHEVGGIGGGELKVLVDRVFPELPMELLNGLIQHLEAGGDVHEVLELPPASAA